MLEVCLALVPALIVSVYLFGVLSLLQVMLSVVFCLGFEALFVYLRKKPVMATVYDGSALLTGMLIGLSLPHFAPWWLNLLACLSAIIFAKQLYGGLGHNPFNPAMVGFAVVLVSFPAIFSTHWANSTLVDTHQRLSMGAQVAIVFDSQQVNDGISGATPLDVYKQGIRYQTGEQVREQDSFKHFNGGWLYVNLSYLIAGLWLIWRKRIRWQISVAVLFGLSLCSLLFAWDSDLYVPLSMHLFSGATMMAVFFIATDPVTAATTPKGRWLYGFLIGVLIFVIRTYGQYPDGVAFAVLLLNLASPVIDAYTQPISFGHNKAKIGLKQNDS